MFEQTSVYERKDSRFWWIAYFDPKTLKRKAKSTKYLVSDAGSKRKALNMARDLSADATAAKQTGDPGWSWVSSWIDLKHRNKKTTHTSERLRWSQVHAWLDEMKLNSASAISYDKALEYIPWRTAQVKRVSKRNPKFNTALQELRFLSRVMREAQRRGYVAISPLQRLDLKKDPVPEKPEITNEEVDKIRLALRAKPEWMQVSFEIALHQGCRLRETQIPFARIDLEGKTVQFLAKRDKVFTTQIHPKLLPLLTELRRRGLKQTCTMPVMAAKEWHNFFEETGLGHLCFHCTRVTAITRMARAGVPISIAMAYVGHANESIHKIYQRLKAADVGPAIAAINF